MLLKIWRVCALVMLVFVSTADADRTPWHLELIIDQSGSMACNDPKLNALVLPSILADLASEGDLITLHPQTGNPEDRSEPFELNINAKGAFKQELRQLSHRGINNSHFQQGLNGAVQSLQRHPETRSSHIRQLIQVYDGGQELIEGKQVKDDLDSENADWLVLATALNPDRKMLERLEKFQRSAMPTLFKHVEKSEDLLSAFQEVFRKLFEVKERFVVQTARPEAIEFSLESGVKKAWLVVLSDERLSPLKQMSQPKGERDRWVQLGESFITDFNQKWGGVKKPWYKDKCHYIVNQQKPWGSAYRVVVLDHPKAGDWSFKVASDASALSYIVLKTYDLTLDAPKAVRGFAGVPITLEVKVQGSAYRSDGRVMWDVGGQKVEMPCQQERGSIRCKGQHVWDAANDAPYQTTVHYQSDRVDATAHVDVYVKDRVGFKCEDREFKSGEKAIVDVRLFDGSPAATQPTLTIKKTGQRFKLVASRDRPRQYGAQLDLSSMSQGSYAYEVRTANDHDHKPTECTFTIRPTIDAFEPQIKIFNEIGPCGSSNGEASDGYCQACGECSGTAVTMTFDAKPLGGQVGAKLSIEALPSGLRLYSGGPGAQREHKEGSTIDIEDLRHAKSYGFYLCGDQCAGDSPEQERDGYELKMGIKVPDVFVRSGTTIEASEDYVRDVTETGAVRFSWWACNGRSVMFFVALLLTIIFIYGFIRPLRFPDARKRARYGFPREAFFVHKDDFQELGERGRGIRKKLGVNPLWYKNEELFLSSDGQISSRGTPSQFRIELRRKDGRREAFLHYPSGQTGESVGRVLFDSTNQRPKLTYEQAELRGEALQLNHMYMLKGGDYVFMLR